LISVIPPTHNDGFLSSIHSKPVIGFSIIVDDIFLAVVS
jgi:hypothetical protein